MHGAGIKTDITTADTGARVLDVTRLTTRVPHGIRTGIDRVERAYLCWLLAGTEPFFALARTSLGYVLLDRDGAQGLLQRLDGQCGWGPVDRYGRWNRRLGAMRKSVEADLRRLCVGRAPPWGLAGLLRRHVGARFSYVNVGHANLGRRSLRAIRAVPGVRVAVLLHDVLPLEHPEFFTDRTVARFAQKLAAVSECADLLIFGSNTAKNAAITQFKRRGLTCGAKRLVAPLGVERLSVPASGLGGAVPDDCPYFVSVGTIEPRKNHLRLVEVWAALQRTGIDPLPRLYLIGGRGWRNEAILARLGAAAPDIVELGPLSDDAMAAVVGQARAALFPSHAEGFGLPPAEAAAMGVPVLVSDLPVLREVLGDLAVYLPPTQTYPWVEAICGMINDDKGAQPQAMAPEASRQLPTWEAHFNAISKRL